MLLIVEIIAYNLSNLLYANFLPFLFIPSNNRIRPSSHVLVCMLYIIYTCIVVIVSSRIWGELLLWFCNWHQYILHINIIYVFVHYGG